jgi:hypothetical protein
MPVNAWFVRHELEAHVQSNYQRKERDANRMYQGMVSAMKAVTMVNINGLMPDRANYAPSVKMIIPNWLRSE